MKDVSCVRVSCERDNIRSVDQQILNLHFKFKIMGNSLFPKYTNHNLQLTDFITICFFYERTISARHSNITLYLQEIE